MTGSGEMFDGAAAHIDGRHREFFADAGDARQVWARDEQTGGLFYLAEGAVDQQIRDRCDAGHLRCPMADCPDPRFVAHGGEERRHHFAHKVAHMPHKAAVVQRAEAAAMLAYWAQEKYSEQVEVTTSEVDDVGLVSVRSKRTGKTIELAVTYDRRYDWFGTRRREGRQLLLGHTKSMLLPRQPHRAVANAWWCDKASLATSLAGWQLAAIAVNPQARLAATMAESSAVMEAGLVPQDRRRGFPQLAIVDALDDCRLDEHGLVTPALDKLREAWARIDEVQRQREQELEQYRRAEREHQRERDQAWRADRERAEERERERAAEAERRRNDPAMAEKIKEGRARRFASARVNVRQGAAEAAACDLEYKRRAAGKTHEERMRLIEEIYGEARRYGGESK